MHKTLVIGIKNRGLPWAEAVQQHPEFDLTGIADNDPDVLSSRGEELDVPLPRRHRDYREALEEYDAGVIVTPNHTHYPIAKDLLEAGLHVMVEKPFAETLDHARELVRVAEERDRVVVVGQNYQYRSQYRAIAAAVEQKTLGELIGVEGTFHRYRPPRYEHERGSRYPMLLLQGIHHLDWLANTLPSSIVEVVSRHQSAPASGWAHPSICHIVLRCANGITVSYRGSYESRGEQTPYSGRWRFEFERGDMILDQQERVWRIEGEERTVVSEPAEKTREEEIALLGSLHAAITRGEEPLTSGKRNIKSLELLFEVFGDVRE